MDCIQELLSLTLSFAATCTPHSIYTLTRKTSKYVNTKINLIYKTGPENFGAPYYLSRSQKLDASIMTTTSSRGQLKIGIKKESPLGSQGGNRPL